MAHRHEGLFDFIIIGAGPAGLSIGSELSKRYHGLIIEKNEAGITDKFWFVPFNVVDDDVKPFTYGGVRRFLTNTFTGGKIEWEAKQFDRYPYVDEHSLLSHWVEEIRKNYSVILDNCTLQDVEVKGGIVTAKTDKGSFESRLLIDASGYNSPLVKKYRIKRRNLYWWSVYGAIGKHPHGLGGDLRVGDYMLWQTFRDTNPRIGASLKQGRPVFEYEMLGENKSFSLILYLRKEQMSKEFMKKEFMHIITAEDSTREFHDIEITEEKFGWYPSGDISQQQIAEDNVVFVGDAGCWTTPCGWGMGFILDNYKHFAKHIGGALDQNMLDKESLLDLSLFKTHAKYEILLNALATHFLANASAPQLDRFINLFNKEIDPLLCEKLFTLTITEEEVIGVLKVFPSRFSIRELLRIIPKEDCSLVLAMAKYFIKDSVLQGLDKLLSPFKKKKAASQSNNGFDIG